MYIYIYLTKPSKDLGKTSEFLKNFCCKLNKYTGNNRTPASLAMRISNYKSIDPDYKGKGLPNGGKSVKKYWDKYHDELEYMENLYNKVINNMIYIPEDVVKDELSQIEKIDYKLLEVEKSDAFIESLITHRNGNIQKIFRHNLLTEFQCKCALCNVDIDELLIASHILPYSKCEKKEDMINHYNGLLLCEMHDALFDKKLISFDDDGKIIIMPTVPKKLYADLKIDFDMKIDRKYLTEDRKEFLKKHRDEFVLEMLRTMYEIEE